MPPRIVPKTQSGPTKARIVAKQAERESAIDHPGLAEAGIIDKPQISDYFRHYIGRNVTKLLPSLGGTIGALGSGAGSGGLATAVGATAGAGLGSVASLELRNEFPSLFGDRPQDVGELAGTLFSDIVTEGVLPEGLSKLGTMAKPLMVKGASKIFPAIKEGVGKYEAGVMGKKIFPESQILDVAAENARLNREAISQAASGKPSVRNYDEFGREIKSEGTRFPLTRDSSPRINATNKFVDAYEQNSIAVKLNNLATSKGQAREQMYKEITKEALSDVQNVRNFKLATGGTPEIKQLAFNDLLTRNYKGDSKMFDVGKILTELDGPKREIWEEAIGKSGLTDFKQFLSTAQRIPERGNNVLQYTKNRLLFSAPAIIAGGLSGGGLGVAAGAATGAGAHIIINNQILRRLMENPLLAKTATEALKTPLTGKDASMFNRVLTSVIRSGNETVEILTEDGKVKKMVLNEDGQLVEPPRK